MPSETSTLRLITATLVVSFAVDAAPAQTLEGVWRGGIKDRRQQPIQFELQISSRGTEPAGRLQPIGRGLVNPYMVDTATLSPKGEARFVIQTLRIVIEGKLAPDGKSIRATWTQFGSDHQPVELTRAASQTALTFFDPLVEIRIPKPPTAVRIDGNHYLFYEIGVSNFTEESLELQSVDIQIGQKTATMARDLLARQTVSYGVSIPPTKSGVVLAGIRLTDAPPDMLRHSVTFTSAGRTTTLHGQNIPVSRSAIRIAPPLSGGEWWAGNGPDSSLHHRAAILPMDGRLTIAQRFAFDFSRRVPGSDEFDRGDPRKLESSPSYGANVLSVADATVTMTRDGLPDTLPYEIASPHPITKETLGGNLIVLDLGQQHWAVYAHLQPNSLRVKPGDRVRRGEIIARLGNSASYSPHLHFQVVDGPDPFSSEGLPFELDEFVHEGRVHRDEMPAGGWTVRFAERPADPRP